MPRASCPRCNGKRRVRVKEATLCTPFYNRDGQPVTAYNLVVPCPVCRPECHVKEENP